MTSRCNRSTLHAPHTPYPAPLDCIARFASIAEPTRRTYTGMTVLPRDNGPYPDGKGSLFEGGSRVAACANWPGKIKPQTVDGIIHAVDLYPTFATLAGTSTASANRSMG